VSAEGPRGDPSTARIGTGAAIGLVLGLTVGVNVVRSTWVPDVGDPWITIALGVAVGLVAGAAAMSAAELGLDRASVPSGLRWGMGVVGVIAAGLLLALVVPDLRSLLEDDRAEISLRSMLWRTVVVIPVATVLVEELLFRGVLLGLLQRLLSAGRALAACAAVFGLWHLLPVWRGGGAGELAEGGSIGAVAGTFVATFAAGLGFGWLRQRSGSLVAPVLAHIGTNSLTFAAAWIVVR
jgi:membrane protease YdiL (CAAX protease family)